MGTERESVADVSSSQQSMGGRLIDIIEAVVNAGEPVGPRGLARVVGIDRSAVGRILQQLRELEIFERRSEGYVPGPRLFAITRVLAALDTLPIAARSVLQGLVERFNETCYVCTLHGDTVVFLYEVQSTHPVRYVVEIGRPSPLHAGAAGRAILAGMTAEEAEEILGRNPLAALTSRTIRTVPKLLEMAAEDAARQYTVSLEERLPGGSAVAAPFFDSSGSCQGSVVFTCPMVRLGDYRVEEIGAAVHEAALKLSARLGYQVGRAADPLQAGRP